jgi:hypothetical protein
MKDRERDKDPKKNQQPDERRRKQAKRAPQLPEKPNEAPGRVPPVRPPAPQDDT